jgi:geranylgeranyl pyrophosphate synthase
MNISSALNTVETLMHDIVASDVQVLQDASRHIIGAGGKRVRPRLLMLAYIATGGDDTNYAAPPAAAIELVHTASVVHDDINDHGVMRRGRPSVNSIWGRTFALLTGDFLFTKVYELMAPYKDMNIDLAEATVALVEGETLQAAAVKEQNFTREVYYQIIALKTAALFKAAAAIGAKLNNSHNLVVEALGQYGFNIGLAFQIVDDVLDLVADDVQLGKTSGIDLLQGRGYVAAYSNGGTHEGSAVAELIQDDVMKSIKSKMLSGDAIQEARMKARQLADVAIHCLSVLPDSDAKREMIELANFVVDRDH